MNKDKLWPEMITVDGRSFKTDDLAAALEFLSYWSMVSSDKRGFDDTNVPRAIALCHSELSEALEADRLVEPPQSEKIPGYTLFEEELADTLIRILGLGRASGDYDVGAAMISKMIYNDNRPFKHGNKKY